jgi:hypothetical protein
MGEEIARYVGQVVTLLGEVMDRAEASWCIAIDEGCRERVQDGAIGDAEYASDTFRREFFPIDADPREHLIEKVHSVAHAARGFASDDGQRGIFERHVFLFEDKLETCGHGLRVD